ncbi:hypothetical protein P9239_03580 [Caballeronia sp. LZ062]|uniref:hypothetical protein n=1 Tax=unclassified Caballeronia TaxID=2646786 RepID=UPI002861B837|nr:MULTISPECIES: hypothetical protein [unclassified Caballeronia]MDR5857167.1 hypothetical protein [Caballeronia sp. LZ050]MDR5869437.1 hypothetical protein [Caballeronia sp. LZ062]
MAGDLSTQWHVFEYEGFDIHVLPQLKPGPEYARRYCFIGHVCLHGTNADMPGEVVHFHSDGDDEYKTAEDAVDDARHIGKSIVDGTHPDLSVLSIVSHHHHS